MALCFSYYPVISFGSGESMNFELSVALIWLMVFDMVVFVELARRKKLLLWLKNRRWLWALLPVWVSVSVIWSANVTRGVLTVGDLWLVYFAGYGMWVLRELWDEKFRVTWWKWFVGATLFVCVWCLLQCVLDLAGVPREASLLCEGCTYRMFGFPHPNGFAIEPQFMGNLLLAPAVIIAWILLKKQDSKKLELERSRGVDLTTGQADSAPNFSSGSSSVPVVKSTTGSRFLCSIFLLSCFFVIVVTLFLTFSRGAIYAFVVGLCFMSGFVITRAKKKGVIAKRVGMVWGVVVLGFLFTLNLQGIMAQVSPTNDTYMTGVGKVINHLSLGVIDLPVEKPVENLEENRGGGEEKEGAVFGGYVAESTDVRVKLNEIAVEEWSKDSKTVLGGVGIGGAGQALYNDGLSPSPKEIVQNQYVSLLLETGVVGVSLFVLVVVLAVRVVWKNNLTKVAVLSLMVAYGVSICFFAGMANALQVYLMPVCLYVVLVTRHKLECRRS